MELEIVGYETDGSPIYQESLTEEEVGERLRDTPEGKAFLEQFDLNDEFNSALLAAVVKRLGDEYSLTEAHNVLKTIVHPVRVVTTPPAIRCGHRTDPPA